MNRLTIIVIGLLVALYVFFSSIFVVNEREQAIVMRFGQITQEIREPGIYFKIPTDVVDTVMFFEDRLLRFDISNMTLQVSGGKFYEVDAFLTYRIVNPRLFRERAQGQLQVAEQRIGTRFDAALRQVYGLREFDAALSEQRPEMMREARDLIRPDMAELGIEIVDVRIQRTDLTAQVSEQTFDRMRAERLAEAALLRARGQEQAQSLRAIADRQSVEIVAAARRDAEILRGEGDAQRSSVFAEAFNRDPGFFDFYRSMQSYRTALGSSSTTMLLSPNSEFFRFFGNDVAATGTGGLNDLPTFPAAPAAQAPIAQPAEPAAPVATPEPVANPVPAEPSPEVVEETPPSPPELAPEPVTEPNTLVPATEAQPGQTTPTAP